MDAAPGRLVLQIVAVTVFAIAIVWFYFTGLYCSDDTRYLLGAIKIALGEEISTSSLAERRVVFLLPAAAVYALTESMDLAIGIYGLALLGLAVVTLLIARTMLPPWIAWAAAAAALAQPVVFLYSGALLPDLSSAFFLALALLFFCRAVERGANAGRAMGVEMAAVGGMIAAGFAMKESSVVLLAIPMAWLGLIAIRGRWRTALTGGCLLAAGFGAVLLLEAVMFRFAAGQWHSSIASLFFPHDFSGYVETQGSTPLARLRTLWELLGLHGSLLFVLAGVASIQIGAEAIRHGVREQGRAAWMAVVAFWAWPTFYFTFGTASLTEYAFPVMQQRYFAPCIVPAALLAVRLLAAIAQSLATRPLLGRTIAAAALVLLCSGLWAERHQRGLIYAAEAKEALDLAMHDAARRFPGLRVLDSDSGWTTDLNRCRALLMHDTGAGGDSLMLAISTGTDLHGQFGYEDPLSVGEPVLMVGHGAFLVESTSSHWNRALSARIANGEVVAEHLGRYSVQPRRGLGALEWAPRQLAMRRAMRTRGEGELLGRAPVPGEDTRSTVDLYRLSPPESKRAR